MENKQKILLVEDDKNLGFVIKDFLEISGYYVDLLEDGRKGMLAFKNCTYQICILDVMMPYTDGFTLARQIRAMDNEMPIIFLTARTQEVDRVTGLRIGADDYITKPFSTEELLLRIQAVLRRCSKAIDDRDNAPELQKVYEIGAYIFDPENLTVRLVESPVSELKQLTNKEAALLKILCQNMGSIVRREIALTSIWGENDYFMGRSMDVYITKLRKFFKDDTRISITNIHNVGFRLEVQNG